MKKRLLATCLALCLLTGLMPASVLAADPADPVPNETCTCTTLCTDEEKNEQCAVCMTDPAACTGEASQPEVPVCTCETLCAEGAANEQCAACMADLTACTGEAPQPEVPVCTCETLCEEGAANEQCAVCMADPAACTGEAPQPEAPVCICETLCEEGAVNEQCAVCMADVTTCTGEPEETTSLTPLEPAQPVQQMPVVPLGEGLGRTPEDPIEVPADNLVIKNDTYYGIDKTWFAGVNPTKEPLYVSVQIPNTVVTIANDAFRDNYTGDKDKYGAVTINDKLGQCKVVKIDFSQATNLTTIKYQAAMSCSDISGVLDLSNTKVETIEKSVFSGCKGLTGVILPKTLKVLGSNDGGSGSVFLNCTGLQFIRTAGGNGSATFELPSGLRVIGGNTFKDCFSEGTELKVHIPESVEIIGSQALYNEKFAQIYIDRQSGYEGYDTGGFKDAGLLILPNNEAYKNTGKFTRTTKTYPVTLKFMNDSGLVDTQLKLYDQSIQYTQDENGIWYQDENYTLPDPGNVGNTPGYDAGWKIYGDTKILTNTSKVSGWQDAELRVSVEHDVVVSKPTVEYTVNGSVVATPGSRVPDLTVTVDQDTPGAAGIQITHPLATEEAREKGTYVYFKYCWWDEKGGIVNGPRSEAEPELFSSSVNSGKYNRVFTDCTEIPIENTAHARTDRDYYLVEIFGYYVENNGPAKQYYKSGHNFIAGDNANDRSYVMHVDVVDVTPVTITPADITIYTGGEGYTGVVDAVGNTTTTKNGIPEPGYYITLPEEFNNELGGDADAADLSSILTLKYENGTVTRTWTFELYGTEEHSTNVANEERTRYIYRLNAGVDENGKEIPIRLKLTDPENPSKEIISDKFSPSLTEQYKAYEMSVYSGGLDPQLIVAELKLPKGKVVTCGVDSDVGDLVVRGLTGTNTTTEILPDKTALADNTISVVAPETGLNYYVNGSNVELTDTAGVRLLVDQVLDKGVLSSYIQGNMSETIPAGNYTYDQQYMDLVDVKNGNAYLTLGEDQSLSIYWKVPDSMDSGKAFYVVHFDGLDRNYDNLNTELKNNPPDMVPATLETINGTQYIKFEAESFSPFVLVYKEKVGTVDPGDPTYPGSEDDDYTLHYVTNGGKHLSTETRGQSWTKDYEDLPVPVREGYTFEGWYWDLRLTQRVTGDVKVDKSMVTLYAKWSGDEKQPVDTGVSRWLDTVNHTAYLSGYPDGTFGTDRNMTRAEVAQMFYALLLDKDVEITTSFSDVPADAWYAKAVNTLSSLGMLGGYPDGTYRPDAPITRAEFAAVALAFARESASASCSYADVSTNAWYYTYVAQASTYGWIGGYPDNTFRPDNQITRAEVCVIVNNMLSRAADQRYIDRNADELTSFADLTSNHWAYYTVMEATNSHKYSVDDGVESWSRVN